GARRRRRLGLRQEAGGGRGGLLQILPGTGRGTATRSVVVEGSILACDHDQVQHSFEVIEHVPGRDAQRVKTGLGKSIITATVALRSIAHRVRFTVNLYR